MSGFGFAGGVSGDVAYPLTASDGTAAAPSYAFDNDADIGMYRAGTNILGISGPTVILPNDNGLVIGHTAKITVGTIIAEFQVLGTSYADSWLTLMCASTTASPRLNFGRGRDAIGTFTTALISGDILGDISFNGSDTSGMGTRGAAILATAEGTWSTSSAPTRLTFSTTVSGANAVTERMRIDNAGNVSIGTAASANARLQLVPAENDEALTVTGYSLTGSSAISLVDLAGTWNTTGAPTLIKANVTNTASDAASLLLDLQVDSSSKFKIDKTGITTVGGTLSGSTGLTLRGGTASANNITLTSTSHATKGFVYFGASTDSGYDETNKKLGIGTAAPSAILDILGDGTMVSIARPRGDAFGPNLILKKARGTVSSPANVAASDELGYLNFQAYFGGAYQACASITAIVDGTPGASDMPGRLMFWTIADGSATEIERMRIDNAGNVSIGTAASANARLQLVPAANDEALTVTGYSLTGSSAQSLIDVAGTWNTSGTPTLIKADVTDTASNAASLLMDLSVGATSKFNISKAGAVTIVGNVTPGADGTQNLGAAITTWSTVFTRNIQIRGVSVPLFSINATDAADLTSAVVSSATVGDANFRWQILKDGSLVIGAGGASALDTRLSRSAANTLQLDNNSTGAGVLTGGTTGGLTLGISGSKIGLFGTAPVVQGAALTAQLTTITFTEPGTPDYAIQALTNVTPFGFVTADEGNSVLKVVANLQTRLAEVEARLETPGFIASN